MAETILSSPFFTELVLPFLLVFTLIFAILDKTKILGEGKRQINAIIAFVIGLILIAFPYPRDIIVNLMPLLAVVAVVFLVFIMLYVFASGEKEFKMSRGLKITFGVIIALVLVIGLLVFSGYWDKVFSLITGESTFATNIFFIIVIIAAIAIVLAPGKKSGSSE